MASCIAVSFSMDSRRHRTSPAETPGSGTNFWSGQRGPGMSEIISFSILASAISYVSLMVALPLLQDGKGTLRRSAKASAVEPRESGSWPSQTRANKASAPRGHNLLLCECGLLLLRADDDTPASTESHEARRSIDGICRRRISRPNCPRC